MALCVLLCGVVTRPGALAVGWLLQAALVAAGFVVPLMYFLGVSFAALWWAAVHFGRKIDEIKRARDAGCVGAQELRAQRWLGTGRRGEPERARGLRAQPKGPAAGRRPQPYGECRPRHTQNAQPRRRSWVQAAPVWSAHPTGTRQGAAPMTQRTLVLLKPDAVRRGLVGEILGRIERKAGWRIRALELRTLDRGDAGAALRRARRQAVLRAAGGVHVLRPGGGAGRRGRTGHRGGPRAGRTDRPDRRRARHRPRRLRHRRPGEPRSTPPTRRSPRTARSRSSSPRAEHGRAGPGRRAGQGSRLIPVHSAARWTPQVASAYADGLAGTIRSDTASPLQGTAVCSADNGRGALSPGPAGVPPKMEAPLRTPKHLAPSRPETVIAPVREGQTYPHGEQHVVHRP